MRAKETNMELDIYDTRTGLPVGEIDIPDGIVDAARMVQEWLLSQPKSLRSMSLHGVKLADDSHQ